MIENQFNILENLENSKLTSEKIIYYSNIFERWFYEGKFRKIKYFYKYIKILLKDDVENFDKNKVILIRNLSTLEIFYKVLDEWFPGDWDVIPFITNGKQIGIKIFIYFPELKITSSSTNENYIDRGVIFVFDYIIYPRFYFSSIHISKTKFYLNEILSTGASSIPAAHAINDRNNIQIYIHSHCNSFLTAFKDKSSLPLFPMCTGKSHFSGYSFIKIPLLGEKSDMVVEEFFNTFLNSFVEYISCESSSGIPYINFWKLNINKELREDKVPLEIDVEETIKTLFRLMVLKDSFKDIPYSLGNFLDFSSKQLYFKVREVVLENKKLFNNIIVVKTDYTNDKFTLPEKSFLETLNKKERNLLTESLRFFKESPLIKIGNNNIRPFISSLYMLHNDVSEDSSKEFEENYLQIRLRFYNIFKLELKKLLNEQTSKYFKTY